MEIFVQKRKYRRRRFKILLINMFCFMELRVEDIDPDFGVAPYGCNTLL